MTENNAAQAVSEETRQAMGEALTEFMSESAEDGVFSIDPFDSRNVDGLLDVVLSKLRAEGVQAGDERGALTWYAGHVARCRKLGPDGNAARAALDRDGGQRARAALVRAVAVGERTDNSPVVGVARFTKKPVIVSAICWTGKNLREVITFTDGPPETRTFHAGMAWSVYEDLVERNGLKIYTLEGKMLANVGDWIIRGVRGEFYPCKPDIFADTYELASAPVAGEAQKPTLYQARTRPAWRPEERAWSKWEDCTAEQAADYERVPLLHDWQYEVRRLYAAPQASEEVRKAIETCAKICDGRSASLMKSQMLTASNEAHKCGMAIRFRAGELMSLTPASEAVRPSRDPDLEQLK